MYTLDLAYQNFMIANERKYLSLETMRYYRENLQRFIMWLNNHGIYKVNKITNQIVEDYMLYLLRTVPNKTSVNTYMRAVRRFINFLIESKVIKPFQMQLPKDHYKIKVTFDSNEVNRILATVTPNDDTSIIMLLLLATGMRSRTLCNLRVCDINFADRYIDLNITKNGEPIILPIEESIANTLKEYIIAYARTNYLFLSVRNNKFNRDSLAKRMNTRLRKLGIPSNKTGVHIFRHTFGKVMSMRACPTAVLQKWFGHSDIRMTQRYVDLYGNDLKNSMNMLPTSNFNYL